MKHRPLIVEIIGPSGAGKSTLSRILNSKNLPINAGITIWGLPNSLLTKSAFFSIPTLIWMNFENACLNYETNKQIIRLEAFYRFTNVNKRQFLKNFLKSQKLADVNFLDEGAIFAVSKMRADSPVYSSLMKKWEEKIIEQWAGILDQIVWLDAPDDILIERIRTREKSHRMKFKPDEEIIEFLARYRKAYKFVTKRLKKFGDVKILKFDTAVNSLDQIALKLLDLPDENNSLHEFSSEYRSLQKRELNEGIL